MQHRSPSTPPATPTGFRLRAESAELAAGRAILAPCEGDTSYARRVANALDAALGVLRDAHDDASNWLAEWR